MKKMWTDTNPLGIFASETFFDGRKTVAEYFKQRHSHIKGEINHVSPGMKSDEGLPGFRIMLCLSVGFHSTVCSINKI